MPESPVQTAESAARAQDPLRRLFERIAVWAQKRASRRTLRDLTDDELRDIGLTRREAMIEIRKSYFWD
jgi:uncharacterized protein YjiS (DUF1127 family)